MQVKASGGALTEARGNSEQLTGAAAAWGSITHNLAPNLEGSSTLGRRHLRSLQPTLLTLLHLAVSVLFASRETGEVLHTSVHLRSVEAKGEAAREREIRAGTGWACCHLQAGLED